LEGIKHVVLFKLVIVPKIRKLDSQHKDQWFIFFVQDGYWNFKETSQVQIATEGTEMTVLDSAWVAGSRGLTKARVQSSTNATIKMIYNA